jgi:hypothetical protein
LDKAIVKMDAGLPVDKDHFEHLVRLGFEMLEKAGKEIPIPEDTLFGS